MAMAVPAAVYKYKVMWTPDVRKKHKTYNDGYMAFHTFNKKAILYNENMTEVAKEFLVKSAFFVIGDEVNFERQSIQISETMPTEYQNLSPLYDRPHHTTVRSSHQRVAGTADRPSPARSRTTASTTPRRPATSGQLLYLGAPPSMPSNGINSSIKKRLPSVTSGPSLGPKKLRRHVPDVLIELSPPVMHQVQTPSRPPPVLPNQSGPSPQIQDSSPLAAYERTGLGFSERIVIELDSEDPTSSEASQPSAAIQHQDVDLDMDALDEVDFKSDAESDHDIAIIEHQSSQQHSTPSPMKESPSSEADPIALLDKELDDAEPSDYQVLQTQQKSTNTVHQAAIEELELEIVSSDEDDICTVSQPEPTIIESENGLNPFTDSTGPAISASIASSDSVIEKKPPALPSTGPPDFHFSSSTTFNPFSSSRKSSLLCLKKKEVIPKVAETLNSALSTSKVDVTKTVLPTEKRISEASIPTLATNSTTHHESPVEVVSEVSEPVPEMPPPPNPPHNPRSIQSDTASNTDYIEVESEKEDNDFDDEDLEIALSQAIDDISISLVEDTKAVEALDPEPTESIPDADHTSVSRTISKQSDENTTLAPLPDQTTNPAVDHLAPVTKRKYLRNTVMAPSKHPQYTRPVLLNADSSISAATRVDRKADSTNSSSSNSHSTALSTFSISTQGPWTEETLDLFSWRPRGFQT